MCVHVHECAVEPGGGGITNHLGLREIKLR